MLGQTKGTIMFINLTNHPITELTTGRTIKASGSVARIANETIVQEHIDGIPIITSKCTAVLGIPEPQTGVVYIVSSLVADSLARYPEYASRKDIVSPGKVKRANNNNIGEIVGCEMFRGLPSAY